METDRPQNSPGIPTGSQAGGQAEPAIRFNPIGFRTDNGR